MESRQKTGLLDGTSWESKSCNKYPKVNGLQPCLSASLVSPIFPPLRVLGVWACSWSFPQQSNWGLINPLIQHLSWISFCSDPLSLYIIGRTLQCSMFGWIRTVVQRCRTHHKMCGGAPKVVVPSSRLFCLEKGRGNPSIGIQWTWPSGKHTKSYGKSPFFMGKSTISMAMLNSYVSLPEGKWDFGVFRCFFSASSVLTAGFNVSHGQSTKKSCFASRRPCYRSVGCLIY